jgi:hypothetical protein
VEINFTISRPGGPLTAIEVKATDLVGPD